MPLHVQLTSGMQRTKTGNTQFWGMRYAKVPTGTSFIFACDDKAHSPIIKVPYDGENRGNPAMSPESKWRIPRLSIVLAAPWDSSPQTLSERKRAQVCLLATQAPRNVRRYTQRTAYFSSEFISTSAATTRFNARP